MPLDFLDNEIILKAGIAPLIFLAFLLLRRIFARFVFKTLLKIARGTKTDLDTNILLAFERPLQTFFIVIGIYFALLYLPLTPAQDAAALTLMRTSLIILLAWGFYNFSGTSSVLFSELEKKLHIELDSILISFASKILKFIIVFLAFGMIADEWGYPIGGFIAGLGIGGLAFALAAQDTIANIFGGIVIILDKPFSIGDWIYSGDVEGTVEDISFRSTKIRTFAQAVVTVPNSKLANQPITNWTRMGKRRISFSLKISYKTPLEKLKKCVQEIRRMIETHPDIHKETIFVRFNEFADSSLDIFLYFFTKTTKWGEFLRTKEEINYKIMEILEREGVSVAFPSRSIYFETPCKLQQPAEEETITEE
ncbi:MAG: mechanosensitive ion channel family protein [Dethiobacteria bacterium]|jgi:MscS family membrane protein